MQCRIINLYWNKSNKLGKFINFSHYKQGRSWAPKWTTVGQNTLVGIFSSYFTVFGFFKTEKQRSKLLQNPRTAKDFCAPSSYRVRKEKISKKVTSEMHAASPACLMKHFSGTQAFHLVFLDLFSIKTTSNAEWKYFPLIYVNSGCMRVHRNCQTSISCFW